MRDLKTMSLWEFQAMAAGFSKANAPADDSATGDTLDEDEFERLARLIEDADVP